MILPYIAFHSIYPILRLLFHLNPFHTCPSTTLSMNFILCRCCHNYIWSRIAKITRHKFPLHSFHPFLHHLLIPSSWFYCTCELVKSYACSLPYTFTESCTHSCTYWYSFSRIPFPTIFLIRWFRFHPKTNRGSARNKSYLKLIGISHVINCAEGVHFCQTNTGSYYYQDIGIKYMGLNILDVPEAKISIHFHETADFIERALSMGSRVLVHCMVGLSRSATIVIAYLIIKRGLSLEEAIRTVRKFREIRPNDGFLRQLIELEYRISTSGNVSCYNNTSIGSGRSGNSMSSASSSVPGEKYNSLESSSSASSSHKYNMKSQFNDEAAGLYRRSSSPVTANFFPSNMAPMSLYSSSFHYWRHVFHNHFPIS